MLRSVWRRRKPLTCVSALLLGGLVIAGSRGVHAQEPGHLQLFISATDANGAPVTDLKPEEVVMSENGQPGRIVSVEKFSLPIKLTITVDNGAQSSAALANYRTGLNGLVEALPPDVEVTLISTAPQPSMVVRPTTDRAQIIRGISRFAPEPDDPARFTDALVEYAERLEKEFRDKKGLNYSPQLVMISTTAPEVSSVQRDTIEKGLNTLQQRGARVSVAMTTTRAGDASALDDLNNGRQALIAIPIVKASRGRYEALAAFSRLATLLPEWGKELAMIHQRQLNQFRVVIERPGKATGQLNNLDIRLTRPGLNGSVSGDGRFVPQP
jgi:hypothetical protein